MLEGISPLKKREMTDDERTGEEEGNESRRKRVNKEMQEGIWSLKNGDERERGGGGQKKGESLSGFGNRK